MGKTQNDPHALGTCQGIQDTQAARRQTGFGMGRTELVELQALCCWSHMKGSHQLAQELSEDR